MRFLISSAFLLGFLSLCKCSAIPCKLGSNDPTCLNRKREITPETSSPNDPEKGGGIRPCDVECLAGTEWVSNCHRCSCSEQGLANCVLQTKCLGTRKTIVDPIRCKPNSTFVRDCNTCVCLNNGLGLCTVKKCGLKVPVPQSGNQESQQCASGTSWESECNSCTCVAGRAECTEMECGDSEEPVRSCAPNSTWQNRCNSCWCTEFGVPFCTKIGCLTVTNLHFGDEDSEEEKKHPKIDEVDHNIVRRSVCKPNQSFKQGCNTCMCASDGSIFKCTQNECMDKEEVDKEVEVFLETEGIDHIERHSVCQALGVFYIGCNTCLCNFDGTDYTCTNKPCPLPEDVELFHELRENRSSQNKTSKPKIVCVANRMFIKDCNTCWCNEDGTSYTCTRKVCVQDLPDDAEDEGVSQDLRIIKQKCRPHEVFEADCNLCFCNDDGDSYSCTKKACMPDLLDQDGAPHHEKDHLHEKHHHHEIERYHEKENHSQRRNHRRYTRAASQPEQPKACKPDTEFRMDCNTCLCDNLGKTFSCTRNDCSQAANVNNGAGNGGLASTRKKREIKELEVDQCEPGSVFEQDCSVCRCTADGKHATCNIRRCSIKNDDKQEERSENAISTESNFRCNPGEQFKKDCNDCTCSADGKSVFCTLLLCDMDVKV